MLSVKTRSETKREFRDWCRDNWITAGDSDELSKAEEALFGEWEEKHHPQYLPENNL